MMFDSTLESIRSWLWGQSGRCTATRIYKIVNGEAKMNGKRARCWNWAETCDGIHHDVKHGCLWSMDHQNGVE